MVVPSLGTVSVSAAATETVVFLASTGSDDKDAKVFINMTGGLTFENITLKFDQTKSGEVSTAKFYCNGKHIVFADTVKFANNAPINIFAGWQNP